MQRFKKAAAAQGTLSSRDLKDIKMRDHVWWTVGCPSQAGHGLILFLLDLFKWTKGATFAPLNTKGNSWKTVRNQCT